MTVQRPPGQRPEPGPTSIRWFLLAERVLSRKDWTNRVTVLAFVVTTCVTAMLGIVLSVNGSAAGVLALVTALVARRSVSVAARTLDSVPAC
jgi:hypothetical protein